MSVLLSGFRGGSEPLFEAVSEEGSWWIVFGMTSSYMLLSSSLSKCHDDIVELSPL